MALYAANAIGAVVVGRSVRDALYLSNRPARGLAGMYIWSSLAIVLDLLAVRPGRRPRAARVAERDQRAACAAFGAALWATLP